MHILNFELMSDVCCSYHAWDKEHGFIWIDIAKPSQDEMKNWLGDSSFMNSTLKTNYDSDTKIDRYENPLIVILN
jgi:hypothetical protein